MHRFKEAGFKQFIFIPSDYTVLLTSPEVATWVVLYKKLLLKILQYSQENTCAGVSFIKRRFQHRCFPVNIAKCLRTPILKNNCEWLLLHLTLRSHLRVLGPRSHLRVLGPTFLVCPGLIYIPHILSVLSSPRNSIKRI